MIKLIPLKDLKEKYWTLKNNDKTTVFMVEVIQNFGFIHPIIINKKNEIIDGNARFNSAKILGLQEIPVIEKEFKDEKEEIEFMLACNLSTKFNEFNVDVLIDFLYKTNEHFQEKIVGNILPKIIEPTEITIEDIEKREKARRNQNKLTDFFG